MPTDTERRDVAHMLREVRYDNIDETFLRIGLTWKDGWADFCRRIADYVEPDDTKVKCVAEVKVDGERLEKLAHDAAVELTGIDRDALLALADEMEDDARYWLDRPYDQLGSHDVLGYADRIRKALGVDHG